MSCVFPQGVFAPIVTPFQDQRIQYGAFVENIERYNATELRGYMPLGSNGEFQGLTDREMLRLLSLMARHKAADKIVVAGCGRESAYATVSFIKRTADYGLDYAFVLAPHYFIDRMTDEAIFAYYSYVADYSPLPVVIYNAPKFSSGYLMNPSLMARLSTHPNIAAMKNSSMHENSDYIGHIPEGTSFSVIAGNIKTFYPGLRAGARAGVLSTASYLPEYCCRLYSLIQQGNIEEAERLHVWLNKVSADTIGKHGVAGVKLGMRLRGYSGGELRLPLLPVPADEEARITAYFEEHQLLA